MLRAPVTRVAEIVGELREIERGGYGIGGRVALNDRRLIEYGEFGHDRSGPPVFGARRAISAISLRASSCLSARGSGVVPLSSKRTTSLSSRPKVRGPRL